MNTLVSFNDKWMPEPNSGCWLWTGKPADKTGRARISWGGENKMASRVSWELNRGPIPLGLCVCHKCDTPMCVNPDHLFLGTRADNNADRERKGRTIVFRGENHPHTKLTNATVLAIREEYENPAASYDSIARKFSTTKATVCFIIKRLTWKHL